MYSPAKDTYFSKKRTLNCRGRLIEINQPLVMGILNLSPDSFYRPEDIDIDGSSFWYLNQVEKMLEDADIIDIGALSTHPGADEIPVKEELSRLVPVLDKLVHEFPDAVFSVDTYHSEVARAAVEHGAAIINDISGGSLDPKMFETIAKIKVPYVLMHIQGTPSTMQINPEYQDVTKDVMLWLSERVLLLREMGVADIIIDPGFGFGKTIEHNYRLLKDLDQFKIFELPVLAGLSRKSMIYKELEISSADALNGTTALNMIALLNGADILRVHDTRQAREVVSLFCRLNSV